MRPVEILNFRGKTINSIGTAKIHTSSSKILKKK